MAATEAQKKANKKYDAKTARYFSMKLNQKTDEILIARLDSIGSVQTYVKELIRKDIENNCYRVFRKNENSILGIFNTADDAIHFVGDYSLENGEDLNPAECNFEIIGPDGKIEW